MRLKIEQSDEFTEPEINIRCSMIDDTLKKIIDLASPTPSGGTVAVHDDGYSKVIRIGSVCYFESVDEKTFAYCKSKVYQTDKKLYELEQQLKGTAFVRISKSCILNTDCVDSVKVLINSKMEARLSNGERVIINRHYVPAFKKCFGL